MDERYQAKSIEEKWQKLWAEEQAFQVTEDPAKPKYYVLEMFPYPSGRIHMGHVRNYSIGDVVARYKRMRGFNVLHVTGWDAFGLPAEQYAVKTGVHPSITTKQNIDNFRQQMRRAGLSHDWDREVDTTDPEYYRWTQWIFLKLHERGLAYVSEETGRAEVSVRAMSGPPRRLVVSNNGGSQPVWRRDGHELLYVDVEGRLRGRPVGGQPREALSLGAAVALAVPLIGSGHWSTQYDVSPDGQRIYFIDQTPAPRPGDVDVVGHALGRLVVVAGAVGSLERPIVGEGVTGEEARRFLERGAFGRGWHVNSEGRFHFALLGFARRFKIEPERIGVRAGCGLGAAAGESTKHGPHLAQVVEARHSILKHRPLQVGARTSWWHFFVLTKRAYRLAGAPGGARSNLEPDALIAGQRFAFPGSLHFNPAKAGERGALGA